MPLFKRWKRRLRKLRNHLARRFFETRYGRELLVQCVSPRILTMTADAGDHLMTFSPHDYIGRKVYRKGHFERDHVERLLTVLRKRKVSLSGRTLLELGGNIGTQTIYFALDGDFAHIVTVEPDPRNFALLMRNIGDNGLSDRIVAVQCAAGEEIGAIDFFQHPDNHGKSSTTRQSAHDSKITVPVRPVPSILNDAGVVLEDVALIFMDIEGYEPVAARSMQPLLERRTPFYLEFSPVFYGPDEARRFADWLGTFYEDCIVFTDSGETPMKLADLPIGQDQFDLLLLP